MLRNTHTEVLESKERQVPGAITYNLCIIHCSRNKENSQHVPDLHWSESPTPQKHPRWKELCALPQGEAWCTLCRWESMRLCQKGSWTLSALYSYLQSSLGSRCCSQIFVNKQLKLPVPCEQRWWVMVPAGMGTYFSLCHWSENAAQCLVCQQGTADLLVLGHMHTLCNDGKETRRCVHRDALGMASAPCSAPPAATRRCAAAQSCCARCLNHTGCNLGCRAAFCHGSHQWSHTAVHTASGSVTPALAGCSTSTAPLSHFCKELIKPTGLQDWSEEIIKVQNLHLSHYSIITNTAAQHRRNLPWLWLFKHKPWLFGRVRDASLGLLQIACPPETARCPASWCWAMHAETSLDFPLLPKQ